MQTDVVLSSLGYSVLRRIYMRMHHLLKCNSRLIIYACSLSDKVSNLSVAMDLYFLKTMTFVMRVICFILWHVVEPYGQKGACHVMKGGNPALFSTEV